MAIPSTATSLKRAPAAVDIEDRIDGSRVLRSPLTLLPHARCIGEYLEVWARKTPERLFLAERFESGWRQINYLDALEAVRSIAGNLLSRHLSIDRPIAILSGNSINHALLTLGAMHAGIPAAPISPAYSLMSRDHSKLREIIALMAPGLIYTADVGMFSSALSALDRSHVEVVTDSPASVGTAVTGFGELTRASDQDRTSAAFTDVGPDTVAKLLFISGSTGSPKGVINTQQMLCANQQGVLQVWSFLAEHPPVMVDWLPWNHTYGGNFIFNMVLANGGSLYIDDGKPIPGMVQKTVANLGAISPNIYCNVPRGFDMLLPFLERDASLRKSFFANLQVLLYASASLPQNIGERLERLAIQERNQRVWMTSGWGATETAPAVTLVHFDIDRAGVIGLPLPGIELKLVPDDGKMELRVRGPNVTPGYWKRPDLTAEAFDEEGFYRIGDAGRLADPADPSRGIEFDGRIAEDFKLMSGTWVHVGPLRLSGIEALFPLAQDIVVTGHGREEVGFLIFANPDGARSLCPDCQADKLLPEILADPRVQKHLIFGLKALAKKHGASSLHAAVAVLMDEPPSIDANKITDKGYINQRAVLTRRAGLVELLYAPTPSVGVVRIE